MKALNLIFGINAVQAAIENRPTTIEQVNVRSDRQDQRMQTLISLAAQKGIVIKKLGKDELDNLAEGQRHQGVIAQISQGKALDEGDLNDLLANLDTPFLLVLDGIQDPHNLGACLRSADAAGVHAVIIPKDKSASITPIVRKVASGAAENISLITVTNLARTLKRLKEAGVWLYGAAGEAEQSLYKTDLRGPIAIILGGEGKGLRRLTGEACDILFRIPMVGQVESLNVSVATGICLFEALRQRSIQ